jgi:hypothetical protein
MEPYFTIMRLPGESREEFILLTLFNPSRRDNMIAWLAARSDPPNYGRLLVYNFPKQKLVYGPRQIDARIDQDPTISQQLSLWNQRGSTVIRGSLLAIPLEQSLIYVQPLYLAASEQGALPELRRVIVAYGNQIAMEPTLEQSLARIFGGRVAPATPAREHVHRRDAVSAAARPAMPSPGDRALAQRAWEAWTRSAGALHSRRPGRPTAPSRNAWRKRCGPLRSPAVVMGGLEGPPMPPALRAHARRWRSASVVGHDRVTHVRARRNREVPRPRKMMFAVQAATRGGRRSARAKASAM